MKPFFHDKRRSAGYARDRMKLLLISERIECSPQMMKMLKSDLVHTVKKYVTIEENKVKTTDITGTAGFDGIYSCDNEKGQINL